MTSNPNTPEGEGPPRFDDSSGGPEGAPQQHGAPQQDGAPQYQSDPQHQGGSPQHQGYAGTPGQAEVPAPPKQVKTGAMLIYIAAAVTLIGLIIAPFILPTTDEYKKLEEQHQEGFAWGGLVIGAIVSVAILILQVIAARAATKGRNWGRITLLVLAIITLISLLGSLSGSVVSGSVSALLFIIGTAMMWFGPGGRWFKELKERRSAPMA